MNGILLRRKCKVIIERGDGSVPNYQYIATITKNIEDLGYTFSKGLVGILGTLSKAQLQQFYLDLVPVLKGMVGDDVSYRPMYPNFPQSVMEEDYARLFINAMVHYWSGGTLYPAEGKDERLPLFDETDIKVIEVGEVGDLVSVFHSLCMSRTSLSETDREDLKWIFKNLPVKLPEEIPLKENVAFIVKLYLEDRPLTKASDIQKYFKTATDVLRLITAMSDGDISLAGNTRFRSFKRRERRLLLELLNNCGNLGEDMLRYRNRWIRVGERLHPGEYRGGQFRKVAEVFDRLRNGGKINSFGSRVGLALDSGDYGMALTLLKERPGELARRLDHLLRVSKDGRAVVDAFQEVAGGVATPVLLQVREHFLHRGGGHRARVFFPKGSLARCYAIENRLPVIGEECCRAVVGVCEDALIGSYRKKEFLGNVYLSERYRDYVVPFSQRSAGKSLRTVARGSRLPVGEGVKALRGFIWWTNTKHSVVDLDLSAAVFDEGWGCMGHVSYTNLRLAKYSMCHSGDITNGGSPNGDGVSEFLDVDMGSVVKCGARYVVFQVYSFTRQIFSDLPHAMFGWMGREDVGSGEIYEPKTVQQRLDLASQSVVCIPAILDCVSRQVIWCDMSLSLDGCHYYRGGNNVESNLLGVAAVCYSMVNVKKPNLYDLINLHVKARGVRVDDREKADVVFDIDSGITPFDTEVFMGEYI